jgi:dehydrogenase/reductase SDR family member 12
MSVSSTIDTLLDRTIALGYGNPGVGVRRHLDWRPAEVPRMDGRVVLVTGAASGLGLAAARGFAQLGASVRALARSEERARDAVAMINQAVPGAAAQPVACNLSSLKELREFSERFHAQERRLDVLVNNAGVMPPERARSADGHELMFATHVLAPFALTALLRDLLEHSAPARVINVSSGGMYSQSLPAGDLQSDQATYSPKRLYARTKREQVVITERWARELEGTGIVVHAMHPGWVDTEGVRSGARGALALLPDAASGSRHPGSGLGHTGDRAQASSSATCSVVMPAAGVVGTSRVGPARAAAQSRQRWSSASSIHASGRLGPAKALIASSFQCARDRPTSRSNVRNGSSAGRPSAHGRCSFAFSSQPVHQTSSNAPDSVRRCSPALAERKWAIPSTITNRPAGGSMRPKPNSEITPSTSTISTGSHI